MARYKGTFEVPANYEPQKAAPFDARQLVWAKADLTLATTWQDSNGDKWIYSGMIVAVASDPEAANNGIYRLIDATQFNNESAWLKMAEYEDLAVLRKSLDDLQTQIDNIEVSGGGSLDVDIPTEAELPEIGDDNTTYYIKENNSIQRWDAKTQDYISYGGATDFDINIIYGGNSNGNETD